MLVWFLVQNVWEVIFTKFFFLLFFNINRTSMTFYIVPHLQYRLACKFFMLILILWLLFYIYMSVSSFFHFISTRNLVICLINMIFIKIVLMWWLISYLIFRRLFISLNNSLKKLSCRPGAGWLFTLQKCPTRTSFLASCRTEQWCDTDLHHAGQGAKYHPVTFSALYN